MAATLPTGDIDTSPKAPMTDRERKGFYDAFWAKAKRLRGPDIAPPAVGTRIARR